MGTTLTREKLLARAQLVYREVEVPGFGVVGLRQRSELLRCKRYNDAARAEEKGDGYHSDRRRAYLIIDQVMIDEGTPMFEPTEENINALINSGPEQFDTLVAAIIQFNEEIDPEKKEQGGSSDSSGS